MNGGGVAGKVARQQSHGLVKRGLSCSALCYVIETSAGRVGIAENKRQLPLRRKRRCACGFGLLAAQPYHRHDLIKAISNGQQLFGFPHGVIVTQPEITHRLAGVVRAHFDDGRRQMPGQCCPRAGERSNFRLYPVRVEAEKLVLANDEIEQTLQFSLTSPSSGTRRSHDPDA